jgi:hypothetical protein
MVAAGTKKRSWWGLVCAAPVVLLLSAIVYLNHEWRTTVRWMLYSGTYKAEVLAQPTVAGELRHIEWDGWGGFGAGDTVVYLVFDPNDSLAAAATKHVPGKFNGIRCVVPDVRRLGKNWYAVQFYTDEDWQHCE